MHFYLTVLLMFCVLDSSHCTGASLENAVITGANFNGADLTGVNFEDALVSQQDQKRLCANDSLVGDSRDQIGCRS
mgnify:CR=1 FL=1